MIRGPEIILACPHCDALARLETFDAVDMVAAVSWTDGYQEVPGVPRQPNVVRCHQCAKLYWLAVAAQVGFLLPGEVAEGEKAGWRELPVAAGTDEAGYLEALREGMAAFPEQELELCIFAWWRANDRFRHSKEPGRFPSSREAVANMEKIVELTVDGGHELVLFRAEALRQLGRFEEAGGVLYSLCSDYALAREKQRELIQARSRDLEVLFDATTFAAMAVGDV